MFESDLRSTLASLSEPNPDSELFIKIARWRLGCGDAIGAAKWQLWSLIPPQQKDLQQTLVSIWIDLGDLRIAAGIIDSTTDSWQQLNLLLQQGSLAEAINLQQRLLLLPPPIELDFLLYLASTWQKAGCPSEALGLLEQLLLHYKRLDKNILPPLANALAQLLEEHNRHEAAASWWRYSLSKDTNQIHPMMRLGRYSIAQNNPLVAFHYAQQVLDRDPNHPWAPDLQIKALRLLGARGSLALLAEQSPPKSWLRRQIQWLHPLKNVINEQLLDSLIARSRVKLLSADFIQDFRSIALWGDSDGLALASVLVDKNHAISNLSVIWLLASCDPLLQLYNLKKLMPQISTIQLKFWPNWDYTIHSEVELLVYANSIKKSNKVLAINVNSLYLRDSD